MVRMHRPRLDGEITREYPYTLREELHANAVEFFRRLVADAVDAPPWPPDIDAWNAAYDDTRMATRLIERRGHDPDNFSPKEIGMIALYCELALIAATFYHGKAPGAKEQDQ